ncbi:TetR/AcrR family transcriptional regulator [Cytophaga hutchinsonii]|nr:TetR/AcrR family transcriptional regulator [Cytophaga hutchinsonii]
MKNRIISGAESLFLAYGVKSITMDEVAKKLGVSKKTIYQHVSDKDELVTLAVKLSMESQESQVDVIHATAKDPIDEVLKLSEYMRGLFSNMNPFLLMEIQRYYPKAYENYLSFKEKCIINSMSENLKWGITMGYYRTQINIDILSRLRMEQVEWGFNPRIFKEGKYFSDVQIQLLEHFLYGICTLKGHKLINKYKQIQEEE